jgi:hypothetical protein
MAEPADQEGPDESLPAFLAGEGEDDELVEEDETAMIAAA